MSNIDKQALREEFQYMQDHYSDPADRARQVIYIAAEALLDELDKKQQYIKLRDQEDEDIALTVGKLRVELEAAKKRMTEQSAIVAAAEKLVRCKGRYHSELNYRALAKLLVSLRRIYHHLSMKTFITQTLLRWKLQRYASVFKNWRRSLKLTTSCRMAHSVTA
ncbi:hypothetical protein SP22_47 [Salmonella phage 22]|uniref:Ead/Ea22-like family protein n=3 Tax=Salmonella phage P22 TaxID=10754 RepID=A0A0N7CDX7_BPP22|nr:hypothetical protein SP34_61 [Salmonella phage 34]AKJ74291.1 hypothetical protein SP25_59 [Salmonella phage 25]AKJ74353.1 hypothetical protein SP22_47 [Salmonella phage 22]